MKLLNLLYSLSTSQQVTLAAVVLLAVGLALVLRRRSRTGGSAGVVAITAALGLIASQLRLLDDWVSDSVFFVMAGVTVVSAVGAVTMRSPVYCAIWFALTLLGTAGLFFFQGAQFLGVATIVVYAGAILVTFLFVLMLSNPEGHALYDRVSWEAGISAVAGALMVGLLSLTAGASLWPEKTAAGATVAEAPQIGLAAAPERQAAEILATNHVERLGRQLFTRYLLAVEVAGTLLMVALVGAVAIVAHGRQSPEASTPEGHRG